MACRGADLSAAIAGDEGRLPCTSCSCIPLLYRAMLGIGSKSGYENAPRAPKFIS